MVRSQTWLSRALALGVASLLIAACGGTNPTQTPAATQGPGQTGTAATGRPRRPRVPEGRHDLLLTRTPTTRPDVDPQRVYTGEDLAFFGGTIMRGSDGVHSRPTRPRARRSTPTWRPTSVRRRRRQDVELHAPRRRHLAGRLPVTCEDIKYGVSRTFATDIINRGPTYAIAVP